MDEGILPNDWHEGEKKYKTRTTLVREGPTWVLGMDTLKDSKWQNVSVYQVVFIVTNCRRSNYGLYLKLPGMSPRLSNEEGNTMAKQN